MIRFLISAAILFTARPAFAGPFDIPEKQQRTYVDVGAAVVSRAAYVGSEKTDTDIFPYLAGEYEGRYFFNPAQGAGVNLINDGKVRLAPVVYFAGGRDAEDTPFLSDESTLSEAEREAFEDAFDVDASVTAGGLFSYRFPYAQLELQAQTPVTGDVKGWRADATLATRLVPLENMIGEGTIIAPGLRASYLSDQWTETYYGLDQSQANLLQAAGQDVDGGFNSFAAFALTTLTVTEDITLVGAVNYTILEGDAKDSLLSPENSGTTFILGLAKRF